MVIRSSSSFTATLRCAISTFSCKSSKPVKCFPRVLADKSSGMIPFPLHKSITFSSGFTFAKPDSRTASIPKQKPPSLWMICKPFLCRSSNLSPSLSHFSCIELLTHAPQHLSITAPCPAGQSDNPGCTLHYGAALSRLLCDSGGFGSYFDFYSGGTFNFLL